MPDILLRAMLEIVTFGVGFSLVFAIAQLCRKDPGLSNYLNFLVYLGNGIIQLMVVLKVGNIIPEHPTATFLFLSAIFFVGPANYLYHYLLLNPGKDLPVKLKIQFAPAAAAFLCEVIFQQLPVGMKQRFLAGLISSPLDHWFTIVLAAGAVFSFAYFLILLRMGLTVLKSESIRKQVLILLAAFVFTLVSIILISLGFLLRSDPAMLLGGMTITVIIVCVFLSNMRYPNFYRIIEDEIKKNRYERSLLKGLDTEIIFDRLTYLMSVENIYKDFRPEPGKPGGDDVPLLPPTVPVHERAAEHQFQELHQPVPHRRGEEDPHQRPGEKYPHHLLRRGVQLQVHLQPLLQEIYEQDPFRIPPGVSAGRKKGYGSINPSVRTRFRTCPEQGPEPF